MNATATVLDACTAAAPGRSESIRWLALLTISIACPNRIAESLLLEVIRVGYPDVDPYELRAALCYLVHLDLIMLGGDLTDCGFATMQNEGMRFVYYASGDIAGIARPARGQS